MIRVIRAAVILTLIWASICSAASAPTSLANLSTQDYDFYPGDFNGDGYTDILYVARDPNNSSGIILSDGTALSVAFQSWSSSYLGINWSSSAYNIIVADFNGDGKADILLQSVAAGGDSYLLLTTATGVAAITQTIPAVTAGVTWTGDQHQIVAGDFDGDGKADVFLQATTTAGLNAIVLADANGQFTASAPAQSWNDGYLGFGWATTEALVRAADFNGDGLADLLLQAQPQLGTGPGTNSPAQFAPNINGAVLAQGGQKLFTAAGVQAWSQFGFGADWSPLDSSVVLGEFNGDQRSDALLQGLSPSNATYLLYGNSPGPVFLAAMELSSQLAAPLAGYKLIPGHFDGSAGDNLLLQSQTRGQSNILGRVANGAIAPSTQGLPSIAPAPTSAPPSASTSTSSTVTNQAIVAPTAAGRTPATFAVSATGTATYSIPMRMPPGVNSVQLKLSLNYDSLSSNGPLGMGWSIGGLSAITRCNKTVAQDGIAGPVTLQLSSTYSDRFCLDGRQLKLTSSSIGYGYGGSTYATEIESFSKIAAGTAMVGNGPASFTVTTKNGLIYTYGGTTDSEILAGTSGTIRTWALSQIADRVGNKISLVYQQSSGTYRIDHILYPTTAGGQGPFYKVLFTYGPRPTTDIPSSYVDGYAVTEPNELNSITTEENPSGTVIKIYNLAYTQGSTTNRLTLTGIQECSASTCLPSTNITYQAGTPGWSTTPGTVTTTGIPTLADLNGDGLPDLVWVDYSTGTLFVQLATSTGWATPVHTGISASSVVVVGRFLGNGEQQVIFVSTGGYTLLNYSATSGTFSQTAVNVSGQYHIMAADIDGDGLDDLVAIPTAAFNGFVSYHNTTVPPGAVNFGAAVTLWTSPSTQLLEPNLLQGSVITADFNGDGRADILAVAENHSTGAIYVTPLVSNGASSAFTPLTTLEYNPPLNGNYPILPTLTDWNGDGCSDIIMPNTGYTLLVVEVSNCAGGFAQINTALVPSAVGSMTTADWDGDGRQDLLYYALANSSLYVLQSTGTGYGANTLVSSSLSLPQIADINGDGLNDLVVPAALATGGSNTYYLHNGASTPPDLAISFTDGFGMNQSPSYVPITNASYYAKYTTAAYPEIDYQAPLYVVSQFTATDGTGSTYTDQMQYYGARMQVQGRGFEGFYARRTYDSRNSLYITDFFERPFPYTGMEFSRTVVTSASKNVSAYNASPQSQTVTGLGGYQTRWFPYFSPEVINKYEVNVGGAKDGVQIATTTKTTTYGDGYGNPTQVVISTTDQDSTAPISPFNGLTWTRTINSTFYNSTTSPYWCLGLPDTVSDQSAVPGQTTQTRNYSYLADTTNCRTTQKTIEPNVSGLQTIIAYGFDTCGNVSSISVTGENSDGSAMAPRETDFNFAKTTSRCQLPEYVTQYVSSTFSQSSSIAYNYDFGVRTSLTDPNGLVTAWSPDDYGRTIKLTRPDGTYTSSSFTSCSVGPCWGLPDLRFLQEDIDYGSDSSLINQHHYYSDGFNRMRYEESYRSNGLGNAAVWTTDAEHTYDSLGRETQLALPYSSAYSGLKQWSYDTINRPTQERLYQSNLTLDRTTVFTHEGDSIYTQDPRLNTVVRVTDVLGKLRQVTDPTPGGTTKYAYDGFGNRNQIVDAIGATTTDTYNLNGCKTQEVDPDSGTWNYTCDSLNEVTAWQDAKTAPGSFGATFDFLSRMTSRTEPEGTSTWTYGQSVTQYNIGKLSQVSGYGYTENLYYNSLGQRYQRSITSDQTYTYNYAYNTAGLLSTVTYPTSPIPTGTTGANFTIQYAYLVGEPVEIQDVTNSPAVTLWTSVSNDDLRLSTSEILGSGTAAVTANTAYKTWTSEILSLQAGSGGSTTNIQNLGYLWDTTGNLTQRGDANQTGTCTVNGSASTLCEAFTPDALNRLSSSTLNGATNLTMSYDAAGDILSKSDVGSYTYPAPTAAHPHFPTAAGSSTFTPDANGNVLTKNGLTQTLASYNLPTTLQGAPSGTTYTDIFSYGPEHQRIKEIANFLGGSETTEFVGDDLEKVTDGANGVVYWRHYVATPSGRHILVSRSSDHLSATETFILGDHLNSGEMLVNGLTGTLISKGSFDPFGERRATNWTAGVPSNWYQVGQNNRHGFTFHEQLDGVGFVHMKGRVYDPVVGRFMSVDPIIGDGADSQRVNPYSYVGNRPLTLTDPTGFVWFGESVQDDVARLFETKLPADPDAIACDATCLSRFADSTGQQTKANSAQFVAGSAGAQGNTPGTTATSDASKVTVQSAHIPGGPEDLSGAIAEINGDQALHRANEEISTPFRSSLAEISVVGHVGSLATNGLAIPFSLVEQFSVSAGFSLRYGYYGRAWANQYGKARRLSKLAHEGGPWLLGVATGFDLMDYAGGGPDAPSLSKVGLNLGVGAWGLWGGPVTWLPAAAYFLLDGYYPGGIGGALTDYGETSIRMQKIDPSWNIKN